MIRALLTALLSVLGLSPALAPPTHASTWAPAASATIHPGVQTFTDGAQCTANFVFEASGVVYIGQAAHCASTGSNTDTNGCTTKSLPLGTAVDVTGASHPGVLAYSSWITMQALGDTNPDECAYNDLALVQLDPSDAARVNPSVPHWGGPSGINTSGAPLLSRVYSYGNSELRFGIELLSPKEGVSMGDAGNGWEHYVHTVTPGIPGDSGSAFLDGSGRALGILSTLGIALPNAGTNGVGDLSRELTYMHTHGGPAATLVLGTESFNGGQLPLGI
ncbi:MAG TPA: hypothetical protein VHD87_06115 [Acidimicrobiales bacterium]|nr:hypothetical protein [Acidimicrobiales bacterium]